jgi:hypothetical protein
VEEPPHLPAFPARIAARVPRTFFSLLGAALVLVGTPLLVFPFFWAGWVVFFLAFFHRLRGPSLALRLGSHREVRFSKEKLFLDDLGLPLRELEAGWIEPCRDALAVVLRFRFQDVVLAARDVEEGQRLLEAAGVGPEQRVLRVPLGSRAVLSGQGPIFHLLGPVLLGFMFVAPVFGFLSEVERALRTGHGWSEAFTLGVVALLVGSLAAGLAWMLVPGEATVGRDGVVLRRLWNRRFFPYEQIRSVRITAHGVQIDTDGDEIQLPTTTFIDEGVSRRDALYRRILDGMRSWSGVEPSPVALPLDRRGRSVVAWREDLCRSVQRSSYREESLDPGDLLRLLSDPASPLEQRVGAALALGATPLDPPVRLRVQEVISSSAHDATRVALQGALDGDLEDELLLELLREEALVRRSA